MSNLTLDRPAVRRTTSVRTRRTTVGTYTGTASGRGSYTGTTAHVGSYTGTQARAFGSYVSSQR